ncbi:MAG: CidA/LrgA family protein [Clostridia bacterium]|nr:CidA/LrgA family protein [Clostridia bacterium]
MKWLKQTGIILGITFLGEVLHVLLPFPIPAGIYGILLFFAALETKLIPLKAVMETGVFLVEIMPVMFIPAAVGLINSWNILKPTWLSFLLITVLTTVIVMGVSGLATQWLLRHEKKKEEHAHE